jgi:hypothetical protein
MADISRRSILATGGLLALGAATPALAHSPVRTQPYTSFRPGEVWLDRAGKPIQAHGGSMFHADGVFYWYGENKEFTSAKGAIWTWGVRCYRSVDLYNWEDLGLIVAVDESDPASPLNPRTAKLDRPHILYSKTTKKFVCWVKIMGKVNQTRTVLTADRITGPYTIVHKDIMPLGMNAGDFDLVAHPADGKAYMYFERVHSELICADLTDDYTALSGHYSTHFPIGAPPLVREGPAFFARRNKYYLATSGTSGYFPNPSQIAVADTYHGPWTVLGDLHPADPSRTSFNSQISCIFKHPAKQDLYIAMADRWMGPQESPEFRSGETSQLLASAIAKAMGSPRGQLSAEEKKVLPLLIAPVGTSQARYVWLPISFTDNRPVIDWRPDWRLEEFD